MRRHPDGALEERDELERTHPDRVAQIVQAEGVRVAVAHHGDDTTNDILTGSGGGSLGDVRAAGGAIRLQERPHGVEEPKMGLVPIVAGGLQGTMKSQDSARDGFVGAECGDEIREVIQSQGGGDVAGGAFGEVKGPVPPPGVVPHRGGLGLERVREEGGGRLDVPPFAQTGDQRTASLGGGDHICIVKVRGVVVGRELRAQEAQPRETGVVPVASRVANVAASHGISLIDRLTGGEPFVDGPVLVLHP